MAATLLVRSPVKVGVQVQIELEVVGVDKSVGEAKSLH